MTLLPNSTLKFNISYSSLTHLSLTSNSMESRVINLLAFKSQAGERNIARVWVGYRKTEYIQHQNAFKIKFVNHCRSVPQLAILVWSLSSVSLLTLSSLLPSFCHWQSQTLLVFLPELLGQHDCRVSSTVVPESSFDRTTHLTLEPAYLGLTSTSTSPVWFSVI